MQGDTRLAMQARNAVVVVGFADRKDDVFNAAAVIEGGQVRGVYHKHHLPNYSVFDEKRYFQAGKEALVFGFGPITFGVNGCEDMWCPVGPGVAQAGEGGAELLLCLSASPYFRGKAQSRERMMATRAADNVAVVAFVNQVGGQDELVFDGSSVIVDPFGETIARARAFEEDLVVADVDLEAVFRARLPDPRRREALAPAFKGLRPDTTEENLQARARGNTLMALSNKFGWLVLTTGNKSEVSVGFCTLYGDTAGGFAILKDVPKTSVYALARWRNERARVAGDVAPIPESTLS